MEVRMNFMTRSDVLQATWKENKVFSVGSKLSIKTEKELSLVSRTYLYLPIVSISSQNWYYSTFGHKIDTRICGNKHNYCYLTMPGLAEWLV